MEYKEIIWNNKCAILTYQDRPKEVKRADFN